MSGVTLPARSSRREPQILWTDTIGDYAIDLAWSRDGTRLAVAAVSGPIHLFGANERRTTFLEGHEVGTLAIAWHPAEEILASAGQDGLVCLWSPERSAPHTRMEAGAAWVAKVAWHRVASGPTQLASVAGRKLRLWKDTGDLVRELPEHRSTIADVAWCPNRNLLAVCGYGGVTLWSPARTDPVRRLRWKGSSLVAAWSPDRRHLATGEQDASVHYWDVSTGRDLQMSGYPTKVRELSWDASGRYLATGGGTQPVIWDCAGKGPEGRTPLTIDGHDDVLSAVSFAPAGSRLACADQSGRVTIRDIVGTRPRPPLGALEFGEGVSGLAWSLDARRLAIAGRHGGVALVAVD